MHLSAGCFVLSLLGKEMTWAVDVLVFKYNLGGELE